MGSPSGTSTELVVPSLGRLGGTELCSSSGGTELGWGPVGTEPGVPLGGIKRVGGTARAAGPRGRCPRWRQPLPGPRCCLQAPPSPGTGVRPHPSSWLLHFRHFQLGGIGEWGEGTVLWIWGLHPPRGLVPSACSTGQGWGHRCCFSPPPWERGPTDGRHWNPPPVGAQGKGSWVPPAGSAPGGPGQPVAVPRLVLASVTRRGAVSQRSPRPAPSSRSPRPRWAGWGPSLPGCHRCRPGD